MQPANQPNCVSLRCRQPTRMPLKKYTSGPMMPSLALELMSPVIHKVFSQEGHIPGTLGADDDALTLAQFPDISSPRSDKKLKKHPERLLRQHGSTPRGFVSPTLECCTTADTRKSMERHRNLASALLDVSKPNLPSPSAIIHKNCQKMKRQWRRMLIR